jgi:hypothetical protein
MKVLTLRLRKRRETKLKRRKRKSRWRSKLLVMKTRSEQVGSDARSLI